MFSSGEVGTCVGCYGKYLPTRAMCCRDCVPLVVHTGAKLREALPGWWLSWRTGQVPRPPLEGLAVLCVQRGSLRESK